MRFLTALASLACVSFAAGAVAKTYTPQNADKYAEERGFPGVQDPAERAAEVQAREADAPDYEAFAHKNGHYVREAMPMPEEVAEVVGGGEGDEMPGLDDDVDMSLEGYEDAHQNFVARSAEPEFESLEGIDTSLEGYEEAHQNLVARSAEPPEFEGLEGVDTSLEGYESEGDEDDDEEDDNEPSLHARDVEEDEEGEDDEADDDADDDDDDEDDGELEGEEHELVARSLQEEGVDTSLEGYGDMDEADDDNNGDTDDDDDDDDEASIQARSVPFRKQGWTQPNVASAMKSAWGSYATKGGARKVHSHGGGPAGQHLPHHAREAAPEPEPEAEPEADPARRMGKGHHAHAGHNHASSASRPGNKPTGSKTSWEQKPTGTKKAGRGGWGFPW
ncbi:hypothetical protein KC316_g1800 [Hortaea werneckii]|nr:hypothetical protein KC324_g8935 [Hortaea werneckii]KAI7593335.1 hypothetical protein KC316_g1800 [Hortaea werneckii]